MSELKNVLSYQVFFTSHPTATEKDLFLTFFFKGKPVEIVEEKNLLPLLSKATQITEDSYRIPNIVEISANADYDLREYFSSFFCVLFTEKKGKRKDIKKKGLLIGKSVHSGYFIIGIWPYDFYIELESDLEYISYYIKELTSNSKSFSEVLLLTEK
jgi:hypothetical protein